MDDIEREMQKQWREEGIYKTPDLPIDENDKAYILGMFPYPSGNAHLGHALVFSISDIQARMAKFKGKSVLHPLGWDSFGLPAENAAIKNNVHPAEWTNQNIVSMRDEQIGRMGFSFDLDREISTSSPEYYKWTQWLLLKMHDEGLLYRSDEWVNWDPVDNTVLANEQVIDGKGWRSGTPIERRKMEQWYVRITDYAEDLWNGLDELNWSQAAKAAQRNWIGRSEGVELNLKVNNSDEKIQVFTQNPEYLYGVSAVFLAPELDVVNKITTKENQKSVNDYIQSAIKKSDVERVSSEDVSGVFTGSYVKHPLTKKDIPVFVGDHVLHSEGSGAVFCVPAAIKKDAKLSRDLNLGYPDIFDNSDNQLFMKNSYNLNGMSSDDARGFITNKIETGNIGKHSINYRLRDWSISRQRFWGAPIPFVKDINGNSYPAPYEELPVRLPTNVDFISSNGKSPLATDKDFLNYTDKNSSHFIREIDTMDTFMCSSWYAWRFLDPKNKDKAWDTEKAKQWMPIDKYVGGLEHANQHLIYFRFMSHFLHKIGVNPHKEPVKEFLDNGLIKMNGHKMSKSKGNVVRPDDMIDKYGADALRMYILADRPFQLDTDWDETGVRGKQKFLAHIYKLYHDQKGKFTGIIEQPTENLDSWSINILKKLDTVAKDVDKAVSIDNSFHVAIANIHKFANVINEEVKNTQNNEVREQVLGYTMQNFLKVTGIIAPHISDSLWRDVYDNKKSLFAERWVDVDTDSLENVKENMNLPIMINGKRKGQVSINNDFSDNDIIENIEGIEDEKLQSAMPPLPLRKYIIVRDKSSKEPKMANVVIDGRNLSNDR